MSFRDWISIFFTGVLALCACLTIVLIFAQVIIYGCQLWQMKKSTDAATKAAKAAEGSVNLTKENAHLDQRAWIGAEYIGFPQAGKVFSPVVMLVNTGRTFAKNVEAVVATASLNEGQIPDFAGKLKETANNRGSSEISRSTIAPNARKQSALERGATVASEDAINSVKTRTQVYFMFGQVTYDDIFTHHHWLTFCVTLTYSQFRPENEGWSWGDYGTKENDTGDGEPPWKF